MLQRRKSIWMLLALLLVVVALLVGCTGTQAEPGSGPEAEGDTGAESEEAAESELAEEAAETDAGQASAEGEICSPTSPDELEEVTLRLNHLPWGMHIPYYVALERGIYEQHGIDITIEPGHGAQEAVNLVGAGKEDFGIGTVDTFLVARSKGVPIVTVAMDQQISPSSIFSLKDDGIETPKDLEGKTLAQPPASSMKFIIPVALERAGVDLSKVKMTDAPAGSEVQLMLADKIDASVGFTMGQPLTLAGEGYETNVLSMEDFGLDLYGTLIFTNEDTLKNRPETVKRFLQASLCGAIWAYDNMAEATKLLLKHRPDRGMLEMDKEIIIFDSFRTDDVREAGYWGVMTDERWANSMQVLVDAGMMESLEVSELYTNDFLKDMPEAHAFADKLFNEEPKGTEVTETE